MQNIIANKEASDGFSNSIESRQLQQFDHTFVNWQRSLAMLAPQNLTYSHYPWIGATLFFLIDVILMLY